MKNRDKLIPKEAIAKARGIIYAMRLGEITYEDAKIKCQPYLDIANKKIIEIAKKYNKKPNMISFTGLSR